MEENKKITLTVEEIDGLIKYLLQIPTQWGRVPVNFLEKKLIDASSETNPPENAAPRTNNKKEEKG